MTRRVVLVPHDPNWAPAFQNMRRAIWQACAPPVIDVLHVGSTAIPGIVAKPIVDMMLLLRRHEDGEACIAPLAELGFEYRGEAGIPGRHFFRKGDPRSHHAHMYARDHPEVDRHIRFRDYLVAHEEEARAYERLKRELAMRFETDVPAYSEAKTAFCQRIVELSLEADARSRDRP